MADEVGSWSRAFMASSGVSVGDSEANPREKSAEWHEAISKSLPRDRLFELAMSRSTAVREAVAERTDCPFGVLASLAHDHRPAVRAAVGSNIAAPRAILEVLSSDRAAIVVKAVTRNEATPPDIVQRLVKHRKEDVRRVAARRVEADSAAMETRADATASQAPARPVVRIVVERPQMLPATPLFLPDGR